MKSHWKQFFKKILITLGIIFIYQLGSHLILPGLNFSLVGNTAGNSGLFSLVGSIARFSIFALSVNSYLSSTIISQILTSYDGIEYFQKMKKNPTFGHAKLNTFTQFLTIFIGIIQSIYLLQNIYHYSNHLIIVSPLFFFIFNSFILVSSSLFIIWLSNQISSRGIGNGIRAILFINLLSGMPKAIYRFIKLFKEGILLPKHIAVIGIFMLISSVIALFMENLVRKVKIHYPAIPLDSQEYLPIKVNFGGVIHVILASHLMNFFPVIINIVKRFIFTDSGNKLVNMFMNKTYLYYIIYGILIVFFNIAHSGIVFDPEMIAKDLQQSGRVIDGVPPLTATVKYLKSVIFDLNIISSIYLIGMCIGTELICTVLNNWIGANVVNFSGISILIMIGITQSITSGMKEYDYESVTKKYRR